MNKAQLIEQVARKTKLSKTAIMGITDTIIETMEKSLKKGDYVKIVNFGTFTKRKRKAKRSVNPQTSEHIMVPPHNTVFFTTGQKLFDMVN